MRGFVDYKVQTGRLWERGRDWCRKETQDTSLACERGSGYPFQADVDSTACLERPVVGSSTAERNIAVGGRDRGGGSGYVTVRFPLLFGVVPHCQTDGALSIR
jgi:hypothetical protein